MKKISKQILSAFLIVSLLASALGFSCVSAGAATEDEPVGAAVTSGDYQYEIVDKSYARILKYTGNYSEDDDLMIPSYLDGYQVKYIGKNAFRNFRCKRLMLPGSVTYIGMSAFEGGIAQSIHLGKSLMTVDSSGMQCFYYRIFIPKTVTTMGYGFGITLITSDVYYEGSEEEFQNLGIKTNSEVKVHYHCDPGAYYGETRVVSDAFSCTLGNEVKGVQSCELPLLAGTYELKVERTDSFYTMKGDNVYGYGKTVYDSTTGGLTMRTKYKSSVRLVATGGVYKFTFNPGTGVFTVKRTGDLPELFLTGNLHWTFKRIAGTNLSVATGFVENDNGNTAKDFKVVKNGTVMGVEKSSSSDGVHKLSEEYTNTLGAFCFNAGESHAFIYNHDTGELCGSSSSLLDGFAGNIVIKGGVMSSPSYISLKLDDNNGQSNVATGTVTLDEGNYSFRIYNKDTFLGGGYTVFDRGTKTMNASWYGMTTLIATGGTYSFSFNKTTKQLTIKKL